MSLRARLAKRGNLALARIVIDSRTAFVTLNGTQWSRGSGLRVGQTYHSQARSFAFGSG
jgi:hypothetical protein